MEIHFTKDNQEKLRRMSEKIGVSIQDYLNALIKSTDLSEITEFPISVGIDKALSNTEVFETSGNYIDEMKIERLKCLFIQDLLAEDGVFDGELTPNDISQIIYSPTPRIFQ